MPEPTVTTLQGNNRGEVAVRFTKETLEEFVNLLNKSDLRDGNGYHIDIDIDEYEPGEATLLSTITSTDPAAETPACHAPTGLCGTCGHHDYDHHASGAFDSTPFCKSCVHPGQHPFAPAEQEAPE